MRIQGLRACPVQTAGIRRALAASVVGVLAGGVLTPLTAHAAPVKPGTAQKEPLVVAVVERPGPPE